MLLAAALGRSLLVLFVRVVTLRAEVDHRGGLIGLVVDSGDHGGGATTGSSRGSPRTSVLPMGGVTEYLIRTCTSIGSTSSHSHM